MIRSSSAPFFPFLSFFSTSRSSGHKSGANSFCWRKERKIDVAVKSVRESLSRNELRTIFISHDWLVSIRPSTGPGCFPLRSTLPRIRLAVVFHPWGERGGGIIRLEPRPTENSHSSLFLRVFFRHALLLSFPPTYGYNVRRVNWTRSHRDCVRHLESSRPLNRLRSSVRGSFKLTHSYFLTKIVLYIYIDVFLLYYYFTRCSRLNYTLLRDSSINGSCKRVRTTRLFLPLIYFLPSNNIIILWWLVTVCRLINQS